MNAKLQTEAMRLAAVVGDGEVSYLTPGEAAGSMAINETVVDRPWQLWKAKANAAQRA
jgi:HCOMODA/2-hydroxy-3-carboxy-muconic semialdehyde decarboxylase